MPFGVMTCNNLYIDYAECAVVDSNGPNPYLYFNRGIDLFKIVSPRTQTEDFERSLLNKYFAQPKVICAADEVSDK
ncbi:unnamed protein product [Trichobilharzia regenti]|nr:unnamed protein product [Trichobilharzia regenti]